MISSTNLRLISLVVSLATCSLFASAQVSSGSIVVFALQRDRFVVAADSQMTDQSGRKRYDQCKILPLDQSTLFAAAGFMEYTRTGGNDKAQSWNAFDIARQSLSTPKKDLRSIADEWATRMKIHLEAMGAQRLSDFNLSHSDNIANGVLAAAKEGSISVTTRSLKLVKGVIQVDTRDFEEGEDSAIGELAVYSELRGPPPPRALEVGRTFVPQRATALRSHSWHQARLVSDLVAERDNPQDISSPALTGC